MQRFWHYIEDEPMGKKILFFFFFWLFVYVFYVAILMRIYPEPSIDLDVVNNTIELKNITFQELGVKEDYDTFFEIIHFATGNIYDAFIEELVFRFAPFFLIVLLYSRLDFSQKIFKIIIYLTIVSAVFIYSVLSHGSFIRNFSQPEILAFLRALLVQGVGGFLLSVVYLKSGGIREKIIKPLLLSFLMHWSSNFCLSIVSTLFFL